jgi:hypothetical protein
MEKSESIPPRVLKLLQLLQERTTDKGCTEAEMREAAAKIKQLLQEYDISLLDVGTRQMTQDAVYGEFFSTYKEMPDYVFYMACAIARGFEAKCLKSRWSIFNEEDKKKGLPNDQPGGVKLIFVGMSSDVEVCIFFYSILWWKLDALCKEAARRAYIKRSEYNNYRTSFFTAASDAIEDRLRSERKTSGTTGTEIVLAKSVKVRDAMQKFFPSVNHKKLKTGTHWRGAADGAKAGYEVQLTRGVGDNGNAKQPLPSTPKQLPKQ